MTPKTDNKAIDFISTADEQRRNTAEPLVPALTTTFSCISCRSDKPQYPCRAGTSGERLGKHIGVA